MATYRTALPEVFPWVMAMPVEEANYAVDYLLSWPEGPSSFAVTADAPDKHVRLWLSQASVARLSLSHWTPAAAKFQASSGDGGVSGG